MPMPNQSSAGENGATEAQWKSIYTVGGVFTVISLIAILSDIIIGTATGGDLSALPQTAIERFAQLQATPLLGLYNLDLLNTVNQLLMVPVYFALYAAHRKANNAYSLLSLVIFLVATTIFVTSNTACPCMTSAKNTPLQRPNPKKLCLPRREKPCSQEENTVVWGFSSASCCRTWQVSSCRSSC